ncbi:hypothetical protein EWH99_05235 [Sporolactobacillus sp. THM7-7]|nr:hypothetical protein EWH99_05235 [Sporolactobacillus sp. THM7-7]
MGMIAKKSFLPRKKGLSHYLPAIILAKVLRPFFYFYFRKKKIALIGGHCGEKYADNAAAMHRFLRKNCPDYIVFFGLNDVHSPVAETIDGPVYKLGSVWNYLLYDHAVISYYSHSLESDVAPAIDFSRFANPKLIKVYMGHGVDGLKKNLFNFDTRRSTYFICSSREEKRIKNKYWGIPEKKLIVTGMPRYDTLYTNRGQAPTRTVLYMPTWREWLNEDETFFDSRYYQNISGLLNHPGLHDVLRRHHYRLKVMLHPFMQPMFQEVVKNNRQLPKDMFCRPDQDIQQLILSCDLLITDYSSVSWDFYYLDKPVLFFQFDQAEYLKIRGAYLDFSKDLFGDVTFTVDETVKQLGKILSLNKPADYYLHQVSQKSHFDFYDSNNRRRVIRRTLPGYQNESSGAPVSHESRKQLVDTASSRVDQS